MISMFLFCFCFSHYRKYLIKYFVDSYSHLDGCWKFAVASIRPSAQGAAPFQIESGGCASGKTRLGKHLLLGVLCSLPRRGLLHYFTLQLSDLFCPVSLEGPQDSIIVYFDLCWIE